MDYKCYIEASPYSKENFLSFIEFINFILNFPKNDSIGIQKNLLINGLHDDVKKRI